MNNKIGLLGGTFSPIHIAHIKLAKAALAQFNLDEVWFIVNGIPPHKENEKPVNSFIRLKMCEIALKDEEKLKTKDFEIYDNEKSYTAKTLEKLNKLFPDIEFFFLMGEDSLDTFNTWKEPEKITRYANILVAKRSNIDISKKLDEANNKYNGKFFELNCDFTDISSTKLRSLIKENSPLVKDFLSNNVFEFINEHAVYKELPHFDYEALMNMKDFVESTQSKKRYEHCIRVADTACALAANYLYPIEIAYVTGLLHDCAKNFTGEELITFCKDNKLSITDAEMNSPYLLHGLVGSVIAKEKYNITDEMAHAIEVHTRGCKAMNLLDKIIFISDMIESGRMRSKILNNVRIMSYKNLDKAIIMIIEDTIDYLKETNRPIDNTTIDTLNYYLNKQEM